MDTSIALSYKPVQLDIEGAMQFRENKKRLESQNALAAAQQAAAQDELNNALAARQYASSVDLSDPKNAMKLMGYGEQGAKMLQALQAGQASSASAGKTRGEYANQKSDYYLNSVLPFARQGGRDGVLKMLALMRKDPDLAGSPLVTAPQEMIDSMLPDPLTQPEKYAEWESRMGLGLSEFLKRNTLTANEQSMETDRAAGRRTSEGQLRVAERNAAVNEAAEARLSAGLEAPLAPKERQKREAAYPKASAAFRGATTEIDTQIKDLKLLRDHPGLSGITGLVYGNTPALTANARAAKAKLKTILARGGFQELAKMRANSPTGGALGNISDTEGRYLRDSYGSFDTSQDTENFQLAIDNAIAQAESSRLNIQQAYDDTYSYRQGAAPAGDAGKPAANANTVTTPDGKVLTFPSAEAAAAFKKAAGLQ